MRRIAAGLAWVGLTASAGSALADDGPPPLAPPVAGPVADPPAEAPPVANPAPRQVLVVPGLSNPRAGARNRTRGSRPTDEITATPRAEEPPSALPPLLGPSDAPPRVPETTSPGRGADVPVGGRPPVTLESVQAGGDDEDAPARRPGASPGARSRPLPPTRRPPGLFGRFFTPPTAGPGDRRGAAGNDSVRVEPRTDVAADAALKRRVEKQIREGFTNKLKMYEVRVVGRQVLIRARPARFWQRRVVRKELESLPALNGLKATVEILE